jgi:hypothetical protein
MGGCRSSAQAIAHPCLSFPHEPAAAAHAIFRGFVGRHDRDAGQDGIVLGCGRLCAAHRRSQSDPSVRTFCGAYIVRQADRAWALYCKPDFRRARHALAGPGAIYISQTLNFPAPVKIGDTVVVTVTVQELIPEKSRARLSCICSVDDEVVLDGEALVKVPARKRPGANGR